MKLRPYTQEQIETADRRIRATCHEKQSAFVFDTAKRLSLLCGRGAGKTSAELMRIVRAMLRRRGNCLYVAATRESAERIAWIDLKRIVEALGLGVPARAFNESKLRLTLPNGSTLQLFGADDKGDIQKLRGTTFLEVAIDECASIKSEILREMLQEVVGPRLIGTLVLLGTPGKRLDGMFWEATAPGQTEHRPYVERHRPEFAGWKKWSSHAWSTRDGVDAGIKAIIEIYAAQLEEKERNGWSDTSPIWLREYLGHWIGDDTQNVYVFKPYDEHGKEFNVWTPELDVQGFAKPPIEPKDIGYAIGLDIGFKDAFALEVFAFSYSDPKRVLWHVYEVYRQRLYANAIAKILIGEELSHDKYGGIIGHIGWPDVMVGDFAGAGGALLEELKVIYGITIVPADKTMRQKDNSIELLNSALYDGQIKIIKGSNLANEMSTLQWAVDANNRRLENKHQSNHACDATLYLRNAVSPLLASAAAAPPPIKPTHRAPDEDVVPQPEVSYGGDADSMYQSEW